MVRASAKNKLQFCPSSVWKQKELKIEYWDNLINDQIGTNIRPIANKSKGYKKLGNYEAIKTGFKNKGLSHSQGRPIIISRILDIWSVLGDKVIDPFSGRGTYAMVSYDKGRHYIGYEVDPITVQIVNERIKNKPTTMATTPGGSAKLIYGDGCKMAETGSEEADLILTCPPYWKQEIYNDNPDSLPQLSRIRTYPQFLNFIGECVTNCYRVLKSRKFCVWVVADFRSNGKLIRFGRDVELIFESNGFELWDLVIMVNNSPFAAIGSAKALEMKRTIKSHEYVLVFKKL